MAEPALAAPSAEPPAPEGFGWFIGGVASWFGAFGMQGVLFSWLVVGVLALDARWVGVTQAAAMLPSVLLILVGGYVADRRDRRLLLIGLHLAAGAVGGMLVGVVALGWLTLPLLLVYALAIGSVQAFVLPARDALLSEVTSGDMMRAVTGMNLAQQVSQMLGSALGGAARWTGIVPALALPPLLLASGALAYARLRPAPRHASLPEIHLRDLGAGVLLVLRSPVLAPVFALTVAVGVLFGGPFMVVFPLLVRDYYGGDVFELALFSTSFPLGTIAGGFALLLRGQIQRKGLAQVLALLAGAVALGTVSLGLPFWLALFGTFVWGICGAVFMNAGRTVFQEQAPAPERARVLATYTMGFMGSAGVVGAPLAGLLAHALGPLETLAVNAASMVAVASLLWAVTPIGRVR